LAKKRLIKIEKISTYLASQINRIQQEKAGNSTLSCRMINSEWVFCALGDFSLPRVPRGQLDCLKITDIIVVYELLTETKEWTFGMFPPRVFLGKIRVLS
jgi:hypothetical protein